MGDDSRSDGVPSGTNAVDDGGEYRMERTGRQLLVLSDKKAVIGIRIQSGELLDTFSFLLTSAASSCLSRKPMLASLALSSCLSRASGMSS